MSIDKEVDIDPLTPELEELRDLIEQKIIPMMAADGSRCLISYGGNLLVKYQVEVLWTESENLPRKAS
jgi:hypothetical protein